MTGQLQNTTSSQNITWDKGPPRNDLEMLLIELLNIKDCVFFFFPQNNERRKEKIGTYFLSVHESLFLFR